MDEEDDVVILDEGDHLIEGELLEKMTPDDVKNRFEALGLSDVIVDKSERTRIRAGATTPFRLIGRVAETVALPTDVRCDVIHTLSLDPYADLRYEQDAFRLFTGETSEVRFLLWLRSREGERLARDVALESLREMGWCVHHLMCLASNLKLPDRPPGMTFWLGIMRWDGPISVVTIQNRFYVDDMVAIDPSEVRRFGSAESPDLRASEPPGAAHG